MSETPGSKALEVMKSSKLLQPEFKTPNSVPKKKKKLKILTEEHYVEELTKIIERDFFPDLAKLKAQNEYLDAVEKNDVIKLRKIYAKYSSGRRPRTNRIGQSPATFETPMSSVKSTPRTLEDCSIPSVIDEGSLLKKDKKSVGDGHSLDSFLNTYTSEDNNSFQEIIEAADQKLRNKFSVLFDQETLTADKLARALTLPKIEEQFSEDDGSIKKIDTWSYKNKNYIMYIPDGVELTPEEKMDLVNQKQEISHSNTRLTSNPFNETQNKETITALAKNQAKQLTGKVGVDGNILDTGANRRFDFVKTPSPCPGEACTPLMTWGEIEGTPFRLDGSDTPIRPSTGPSFRINENSRRETIALELAEKAGERMRGQKQKAIDAARRNITSPHIRSSIDRLASMSPAAKRLATMKLGLRTNSATPIHSPRTPTITPNKRTFPLSSKSSPSPIVRRKLNTPSMASQSQLDSIEPRNIDLTDDLLKIPSKRPKAADFF